MQEATGSNPVFSTSSIVARFSENLDKYFDMKTTAGLLYKTAEIYNAGGDASKTWFVYYYYRRSLNDKFQRFRITGDVNRIADAKLRQSCLEILKQTVNEALTNGFNPFNEKKGANYSTVATLTDAMNEALTTKTLKANKTKTATSYKAANREFLQWMKQNKLDLIPVTELKPSIANDYQLHLLKAGANSKTINRKFSHLSNLYKICMVNHEEITRNPFDLIDNLKENDSRLYEAHTAEEVQKWSDYLKRENVWFFNVCLFIYYCGMRPESISALKISDVLLKERKIIVDPAYHKNNHTGYKQILAPHLHHLEQLQLHKYNQDYYLFSHNFQPGSTKRNATRMGEYWKEKIIQGLGINKKLYAIKHTFAQNYLDDNRGSENLDWLRWQFNHSSLAETDAYAKSLQMNFIDEKEIKLKQL